MSNNITELREILFETLRSVKTGDEKAIARAKAVSEVSQTIINTVRLEIDHVKATGQRQTSGFLTDTKTAKQPTRIADMQPSVVHKIN